MIPQYQPPSGSETKKSSITLYWSTNCLKTSATYNTELIMEFDIVCTMAYGGSIGVNGLLSQRNTATPIFIEPSSSISTLLNVGWISKETVTPDSNVFKEVSIVNQEKELTLHEQKLAKMEADMTRALRQKVTEKQKKLQQSEEELYTTHHVVMAQLERQLAELEELKKAHREKHSTIPESMKFRDANDVNDFGVSRLGKLHNAFTRLKGLRGRRVSRDQEKSARDEQVVQGLLDSASQSPRKDEDSLTLPFIIRGPTAPLTETAHLRHQVERRSNTSSQDRTAVGTTAMSAPAPQSHSICNAGSMRDPRVPPTDPPNQWELETETARLRRVAVEELGRRRRKREEQEE